MTGKKRLLARGAATAVLLAMPLSSTAAVLTATVTGQLAAAENACWQVVHFISGSGCNYGADRPGPVPGWAGPALTGGYYAPGSAGATPGTPLVPGDGKINPHLSGSVSIDDNGTPLDASDDLVSATLVVGPAVRKTMTGQVTMAQESWSAITHILAPTVVNHAIANDHGGMDYVIGLQGFPELICATASSTDCFASENAPQGIPPGGFWNGPEPDGIGIERAAKNGGNAGAATTAILSGYSCSGYNTFDLLDHCLISPMIMGGPLEDPGFDNLLLKIATSATGDIIGARGYWTQEFYMNFQDPAPGDNSWWGGTLQLTAVPLPGSVWLLASGVGLLLGRSLRGRP